MFLLMLSIRSVKLYKSLYFYNFRYEFNKKFINMTVDASLWDNKTRKDPAPLTPDMGWLFKDLSNANVHTNNL